MRERWLSVPGHDGYEVSDLGRVRSWRGRWRRTEPRLLRQSERNGYMRVSLYDLDGASCSSQSVHALVALAFHGPRPEGNEVRHLNGDRYDNRLSNVAYGTPSENRKDAVRHGTHNMSSRTSCPKGHAYDEENTYLRRNGKRDCRACNRERVARRKVAA